MVDACIEASLMLCLIWEDIYRGPVSIYDMNAVYLLGSQSN